MASVIVMAFILFPLLAAPGAAYAYAYGDVGLDINEEIIQEVIDPCFLAVAHQTRRNDPDVYKGMSDNDLLSAMRAMGQDSPLTMASEFADSLNLERMTRKERFRIYKLGRERCISRTKGN